MHDQNLATNLQSLNRDELARLIDNARALQATRRANKIVELRDKWNAEAKAEGIAIAEIIAPVASRRRKSRATYHFPDGTTWDGKGRVPARVRAMLTSEGVDAGDSNVLRQALMKYIAAATE